jgi:tetratricopeptide (TPR) repeat protein
MSSITLPTYEEGKPDPNPPFDVYASTEFNYPYTLRTSLTGAKTSHTWRAVILENEYLKCTILPDLGGHIYTCIDKLSGQPMFYENPSIKKAEIGHRGAWAAFGVEYNFPVSHNWVSLSPVDFAYATRPDGSASVTIGNIDRPYGMQWSVELILRSKSSFLEEHVTLYNRSDVRHRYYWWDNAAVQVWDDSRIDYPMHFVASHGFTDVYHWPILSPDGKDLSLLENHTDGPVSYFSHGSHETFMGIWNPRTNTGTAQFSEYQDLPAKKIWSWGSDADGRAWRTALSDNQSAYVEVQAGLFRNQETYSFLDPGQTIRFTEYWMPVRGTDGISRANKTGVVKLDVRGAQLTAHLEVNTPIPHANLSLSQGSETLWHQTLDLDPAKTWTKTVDLKTSSPKATFELKDQNGHSLLKQTDGGYDWDPEGSIKVGPQTPYQMPGPEQRSADDWLQLGTDQEVNGQVVQAIQTYQTALKKFPHSFSLEVADGRLAASLQRYAEAVPLLQDAQKRDTPNSVVAYYLGISEAGLGNSREAESSFDIAFRQSTMRAAAATRLGEMQSREGNLPSAISFLTAALAAAPQDNLAQEELEAVIRASGDTATANDAARRGLAADPTSDFLKRELGLPDKNHLAADPYRVLRVAAEYMNLGLYQRALDVLTADYTPVPLDESEPGSVLPQNHPLVLYYAAYCRSKLNQDQHQNWETASRLSANLVFPSTETDRLVLESALAENKEDATAHYLLGTMLFSEGLFDAGIEHWSEAKRLSPKMPVVDADLGKAWLLIKQDTSRAQQAFIAGSTTDPGNAEVYVGLDQSASLTSAPASERAAVLSRYPLADSPESKMPADLVYQLALTRAEAGQFPLALALFTDRFLPREEGAIASDQVLFEVKLMQAEADAKASQCEQANAFLADAASTTTAAPSSRTLFKMSAITSRCGRTQDAASLLQKSVSANPSPDNFPWMIKAAHALGSSDIAQLEAALRQTIPSTDHLTNIDDFSGHRWYTIGMAQATLHENARATQSFRNALLLPDSFMSHHLTREALASLSRSVGEPKQ